MNDMNRKAGSESVRPMCLAVLVLLASLGLAGPRPASAGGPAKDQPSGAAVVGWLGITLIDCRGACTLTMDEDGANLEWFFPVEPRIAEVAPGSPAARTLRAGDRIVAIDGFLITTPEGGRRFANIEPGSTVLIRFRRGGRVTDARLRAGSRRGPAVEGVGAFPPLLGDSTPSSLAGRPDKLWAGPGILIQYRNMPDGRQNLVTLPRPEASRRAKAPDFPRGDLGLGFSCGPCSNWRGDDGWEMWTFDNPIEVIGVRPGGPSEKAGIRLGDLITHINGARIESKKGGEAFSTIRRGQAVQFTVIGKDGRQRTATVVPS